MVDIKIKPGINQFFINEAMGLLLWCCALLFSGYDGVVYGVSISTCSLYLLLIFSLVLGYKLWYLSTIRWTITAEQIVYTRGIFTREKDFIELYRVYDFNEVQTFIQRLLSVKTVVVISTDNTHPNLNMVGVNNCIDISDIIRERVETAKKTKKIYEVANN